MFHEPSGVLQVSVAHGQRAFRRCLLCLVLNKVVAAKLAPGYNWFCLAATVRVYCGALPGFVIRESFLISGSGAEIDL